MTTTSEGARVAVPIAMAVKTVVATATVTAVLLISGLLDPLTLLVAGENGQSLSVIMRDFPDGELIEDSIGHDGQQFYATAAGLPDLDTAAETLDEPQYRLLRILAPLVASLAPDGDATIVVFLALNIVGLGLAVGGLASLCEHAGRDPGFGWLALVPIILPTFMTLVDPLATGLTLAALALLVRDRLWPASALFALGCLTRESVAITVAAAALVLLVQRRDLRAPLVLGLSVLPLAAWYVYLTLAFEGSITDRWGLLAFLHMPVGVGVLVVACFAVGVLGTWGWRAQPIVAAAAATQVVQIPFYFEDILLGLNLTRVVAVALALGLVVVADLFTTRVVRRSDSMAIR